MEKRRLGKTDMLVSVLGLGGAEIGFEKVDDVVVDRLIGAAADAGVNVIDTAAMYQDSEEKIGHAIRNRRDRFFIFTKCGLSAPSKKTARGIYTNLRHKISTATRECAIDYDISWTPSVLEWNIDRSLRRLGVDCIDVVLLHSCSEQMLRQGVVIEVLERARQRGKARYIGYSGDGAAALVAVQSRHFDVLQTSVNVADQEAIEITIPLAARNDVGVIAKRPIANQLWKNPTAPDSAHNTAYRERLRKLRYDFLNGDRAIESALRFTLSVPGVHSAIVGTTKPAHLRHNLTALASGSLSKEAFEAIRATWCRAAEPSWVGQI